MLDFLPLSVPLMHDTFKLQNVGGVIVAEGPYCCNNMGENGGEGDWVVRVWKACVYETIKIKHTYVCGCIHIHI